MADASLGRVTCTPLTPEQLPRPKTLKRDLDSYFAAESRKAREAAGLSGPQVSALIGYRRQRVAAIEQAHEPHQYTVRDLARAPRPLALHMLRAVAHLHGADVVDAPTTVPPASLHERNAVVSKELLDVVTGTAVATADGIIDAAEADALLKEIQEAKRVIAELELIAHRARDGRGT